MCRHGSCSFPMSQIKGECAVCHRIIRSPGDVSVRPFNQTDGDILNVLGVFNKNQLPWSDVDTEHAMARNAWVHTSVCRKTGREVRPYPLLVEKLNAIFRNRGVDPKHWLKVEEPAAATTVLSAASSVAPVSKRQRLAPNELPHGAHECEQNDLEFLSEYMIHGNDSC
jgi:hypothetical protein